MGCGCGNKGAAGRRPTTMAAPAAPAAATLFEVVKDGRVIYRTRDEGIAKNRRDNNPGSHYRKAGTTTPL